MSVTKEQILTVFKRKHEEIIKDREAIIMRMKENFTHEVNWIHTELFDISAKEQVFSEIIRMTEHTIKNDTDTPEDIKAFIIRNLVETAQFPENSTSLSSRELWKSRVTALAKSAVVIDQIALHIDL